MINNKISILNATRHWVRGFNAFPQTMLSLIIEQNPDAWSEVTIPAVGDSVFMYETSERGEIVTRDGSILFCVFVQRQYRYHNLR